MACEDCDNLQDEINELNITIQLRDDDIESIEVVSDARQERIKELEDTLKDIEDKADDIMRMCP